MISLVFACPRCVLVFSLTERLDWSLRFPSVHGQFSKFYGISKPKCVSEHSEQLCFFSRAASPERSDLSSHYGVCMYVCMYGCSLVEIFFTKGIFFDTRFGLIHVQTGKKNFLQKNFFALYLRIVSSHFKSEFFTLSLFAITL